MADVAFSDLGRTFRLHQGEYEDAALRVLRSGWYILGKELESFETAFASWLGMRHCAGVGCGQDALILAVRALGIGKGDEVIVAGNSYIATVLGVTENGATPVFVDCDEYYGIDAAQIENVITDRTRAVLLTNLYGQCSDLAMARALCDKHGIYLIEDCAQAHGAAFDGRPAGTYGDVLCFSFYPTKPIGAFGDAGAIVTNNDEVDDRVRMLRNYGSKKKYVNEITGTNSRLDEIQAALLMVNLRHYDELTELRLRIAGRYLAEIVNPRVELPKTRPGSTNVYHIFPVRSTYRDELREYLAQEGIHTQVHYPIPPHRAQCYAGQPFTQVSMPCAERFAAQELSLPIYAGMPDDDVSAVIDAINAFTPAAR